jgi:hypothetical protein
LAVSFTVVSKPKVTDWAALVRVVEVGSLAAGPRGGAAVPVCGGSVDWLGVDELGSGADDDPGVGAGAEPEGGAGDGEAHVKSTGEKLRWYSPCAGVTMSRVIV